MDLFEHRYYRLNKKFMSLIGQWPYQSARTSRAIQAIIFIVAITGLPPPIMALVRFRDDPAIVIEFAIAALFVAVSVMKGIIGVLMNTQKALKLLNRICKNWQVWVRCREVNILHEYAERGEKMTIIYIDLTILPTAAIYSTNLLFTVQPMIAKIVDIVLKNGTEIAKFEYPVDYYYFDAQNYYWYINLHCYLCACVVATPLVASDSMLIIYVQHVCSVFAALGYASLIEATYTWNLFFTIGLGMILIIILGVQVLLRTNEPATTIRYIAFILAVSLVWYVTCSFSQTLTDHSNNIRFYIYNSQWYRLLPRDQKLLRLMIIRCRVPCRLTAGKMLIMSMENFLLTIRTSMSYFAVVRPR